MISESHPYRQEFLELLHNEAKYETSGKLEPRKRGFILIVHGERDLAPIQDWCAEDTYNSCLTARYAVGGGTTPENLLLQFLLELGGAVPAGAETVGRFDQRGMGDTKASRIRSDAKDLIGSHRTRLVSGKRSALHRVLEGLEEKFEKGDRVVVFCEVDGRNRMDVDEKQFHASIAELAKRLPERIGLVFSGLPVDWALEGVDELDIPEYPIPTGAVRPQAPSNDSPVGDDALNIETEVHALADALCLADTEPPLVLGVLGGWGTGKSFVMNLLRERILEIRSKRLDFESKTREEDLAIFPYVGHPYVIEFNAWTYAKSSLWASLMQAVFVELDRQISLERWLEDEAEISPREDTEVWRAVCDKSPARVREILPTLVTDEARALLEKDGFSGEALWGKLNELRAADIERLQRAEEELARAETELGDELASIEADVDETFRRKADEAVWEPVFSAAKGRVATRLKQVWETARAEDDRLPTREELQAGFGTLRKVGAGAAPEGIAIVIGAVVVFALSMFLESDDGLQVTGLLTGGLGTIAPLLRFWQRATTQIGDTCAEYDRRFAGRIESLEKERDAQLRQEIARRSDDDLLRGLQERRSRAAARVEQLRQVVGVTAAHASVLDFLRSRLDEGTYEKHLGLVHLAQRDLEQLSDGLFAATPYDRRGRATESILFPRGDPRIVLFVDDLDRCPPDQVVAVLEAAQLLVKTRLFVVVIGMDVRYVSRCLEKEYKEILDREGVPTGLDYIEKIVQIPYRVRPIQEDAIEGFVRSQVQVVPPPEVELPSTGDGDVLLRHLSAPGSAAEARRRTAPLPAEVQLLDDKEVGLLEACLRDVPISPRAAKRLFNTFKLLKNIWFRLGRAGGPKLEIKHSMLVLLCLSALYPRAIGPLLEELIRRARSGALPANRHLHTLMRDLARELETRYPKIAAWDEVRERIETTLPSGVKVRSLELGDLDLVQSFSFCGEVDPVRPSVAESGELPAEPNPGA